MHKDIFYSTTGLKLLKHSLLITSYIQFIKQESKVLACYFLTSLLKTVQLITPYQDKQSNSFNAQGPVSPARQT